MAISEYEITDWVKHLESLHGQRIREQETDQAFYDDTYKIPIVEDERYVIRSGFVSGMVNSIVQQAIAFVPKVYTEAKGKTTQSGADNVARLCNKWAKKISKQAMNPFRETFKSLIGTRGEAWIYIPHNDWLTNYEGDWREEYNDVLPVHFLRYDPMVVFHDPSEDIDGRPQRVAVKYKRTVADIKSVYPYWVEGSHKLTDKVDFCYYVDSELMYAMADGHPLFTDVEGNLVNGDGMRSNLYGCVNFVHKYSGYGSESSNGEPSSLAFSRTRMIRDRVMEDSSMATDFRYNQHELAWKIKTIFLPQGTELPDDYLHNYRRSPNTINVVMMPQGGEMKVEETQAFGADAYAYRNQVRSELNAEHPFALRGVASGESGRQEDIMGSAAMSMYDTPIEACASLWAEAFDTAIKMCGIKDDLFNIRPKGLSEKDCRSYEELTVDIKRQDPTDLSRRAAEGDRRYSQGIIDLDELYINYMGKTKDEAMKLKARVWIEMAMKNDPSFMQMIIQTAAEELGAEEKLNQIRGQIQGAAAGMNPSVDYGSQGGEPRLGNFQSPTGIEMADVATRKEGRLPPRG